MTTLPEHPAKFTQVILDHIWDILYTEVHRSEMAYMKVLDPFAGTGRIHDLMNRIGPFDTYGIEIEPEWASYHQRTQVGNALALPFGPRYFNAVATSPTYGNRMADHHNAKDGSVRVTYKHKLGRDPHPDNSGTMHFGPKYKEFHRQAWAEVTRVLKLNGLFIVNVSDFIKNWERVDVTGWHCDTILEMGYSLIEERDVPTPRMGFGANGTLRVESEKIFVFRKTGVR